MDLENSIAEHLREIPRSGIRDFFELVQGRDDVISLGVGEPDYSTPWHIREAAIYSLEKGETSYTSNLGLMTLRRGISDYVEGQFGVRYSPDDEILVTVGVSEALDLTFRALLNPGDEVLFHQPCYVSYHPGIIMARGVGRAIETKAEDNFALMADDVEKHITEKTRILVINFPTNPTGAVEPVEELEKIAALAVKHNIIVVSDEIYSELTYGNDNGMKVAEHVSIASLPGMKERTILLHGFSKAFAMTGFRLGYACAPSVLIDAMMKIHQYAMLCAPITSQAAAIEALQNGAVSVEEMRQSYATRRNLMLNRLAKIRVPCFTPGGAFYMFPDVRKFGLSSSEFALKFLEEENVAVVPGSAFGDAGEGFVRCCYATAKDQLEVALERLGRFTEKLR